MQRQRIQRLTESIAANRKVLKAPAPGGPEQQAKAQAETAAAIARDETQRDAAETALAALKGEPVRPERARAALAVEKENLSGLAADAATPAEVQASVASVQVLDAAAKAQAAGAAPPNKAIAEVELPKGGLLHYGPTISLLRVSALRNPGEPGRFRNYEGRFELVPAEFGFQFLFAPPNEPWRYRLANGKKFQLLSAGGMLLARIDKDDVQRGNLSLAATLSFFQEIIGLGVGVDLYRGVPVQGADGQSGSDTAFTGLLAWSLMRRGEVTPENVFFVVTLGLEPLVRSVTGEL